jgi:hypothetical protein
MSTPSSGGLVEDSGREVVNPIVDDEISTKALN